MVHPDDPTGFERLRAPDSQRPRARDGLGKEALYSTAPTAQPAAQLVFRCRRCGARAGLRGWEAARLLAPPWLGDPVRRRVWTRCPSCGQRSWLELRAGPALRVLVTRGPAR